MRGFKSDEGGGNGLMLDFYLPKNYTIIMIPNHFSAGKLNRDILERLCEYLNLAFVNFLLESH